MTSDLVGNYYLAPPHPTNNYLIKPSCFSLRQPHHPYELDKDNIHPYLTRRSHSDSDHFSHSSITVPMYPLILPSQGKQSNQVDRPALGNL